MKTNYEKLTMFEGAAVFVAVIGLSLIGYEFYYSLPASGQAAVADAVGTLDIHAQLVQISDSAAGTVEFVFDTSHAVLDQFQLAFAQTFSYPQLGERTFEVAQSVADYTQAMAETYSQNSLASANQESRFITEALSNNVSTTENFSNLNPAVSGASIDNSSGLPVHPQMPYSYDPPAFLYNLFSN